MKLINLQQGSTEWHETRAKHFTASEAPAMMGDSKYLSRTELLDQKKTGVTPEVTESQQFLFDKGHAAEAKARPIAESMINDMLDPVTAVDDQGWLLSSYDGLNLDNTIVWEHKLYGNELAENIRNNVVEPHYYWQLEQQLLVSGAEKALFMCSDGTEDNMEHCWYESVPERRAALIEGWKQFEADLATHEVKKAEVAPEAKPIETLPSIFVDITGEVKDSNLATVSSVIKSRIEAIKTDLVTDEDFVDAKAVVKFLKEAEDSLEVAKKAALSRTADIEKVFATLDELKSLSRTKRLALNKQVTAQETSRKAEIIQAGRQRINAHVSTINTTLGDSYIVETGENVAGAAKNKRTLKTLEDAVDTEVARVKIELNQTAALVKTNLNRFEQPEKDGFSALFTDKKTLALKPTDDLEAIITGRIAEHKAQQIAAETNQVEAATAEHSDTDKATQELEQIRTETAPKTFTSPVAPPGERSKITVGAAGVPNNEEFLNGYKQALQDYAYDGNGNRLVGQYRGSKTVTLALATQQAEEKYGIKNAA